MLLKKLIDTVTRLSIDAPLGVRLGPPNFQGPLCPKLIFPAYFNLWV